MRWKVSDPYKWHRWFAWYPVKCGRDGVWVWMEKVYRIKEGPCFWAYTVNLTERDKIYS